MMHDPNLVEHGPKPSVESMTAFLNGAEFDVFHCHRLLLVDALVNAERLSFAQCRKILDFTIKTLLQP